MARKPIMRSTMGAVILAVLLAQTTLADDFRVVTTIGDENEIQARTTTIFYQSRVFDLSDPKGKEFTVFDPKNNVIHLIDLDRMMRTTLQTADLAKFTAALKQRAPAVKAVDFINPKFKETTTDNKVTLTSAKISYDVDTLRPKWPGAVKAYLEFADWYSQLNATNTRNLPPFARMALNEALAKKDVLPETVRRQLTLGSKTQAIEAKHQYYWALSRDDRELCETVGGHLVEPEIQAVDFGRYRKKVQLANRPR